MSVSPEIPDQVRLPLRVALGVVAQGIRIRLGRSVVTLTGVALGIAFLMSILTSQALKRAVAAEDALRETATRMYGALVAESGSIYGRPLGLVVTSAPSDEEQRLIARLVREGTRELRVWAHGGALPGDATAPLTPKAVTRAEDLGRDAAALVVVGEGPLPALDWDAALRGSRQKILGVSRQRRPPVLGPGSNLVELARPLPPEQRALELEAARRDHFRALWIVAISLIVTVIGISNAMLMSVTERFRDIGTMKCLGATSRFIRRLFLLEASFMGAVGGLIGVIGGLSFAAVSYVVLYGPALMLHALADRAAELGAVSGLSLLAGIVLSIVAALYPAHFAAGMLPAAALRSNI